MRTDHGGGVPDSTTFAQTLSELKREGSSLLVVGQASDAAHEAACRRLLGVDGDEPRHRLFVLTDAADGCAAIPADPAEGGTTTVVVQGDGGRTSPVPDHASLTTVEGELLGQLGSTALGAVDELEADHDGFDPAEFRFCFDSVRPLLSDHRSETVFRLLHMLTSRVRQSDGMGHFHLRLDHENDYVRLLEPLFDAVVEVRSGEETIEQRWHLRDREVTSDWVEL